MKALVNAKVKKYIAYMLDLSQYTGARKIRDFEIVEFWNREVNLRQLRYIYNPEEDYSQYTEIAPKSSALNREHTDNDKGVVQESIFEMMNKDGDF